MHPHPPARPHRRHLVGIPAVPDRAPTRVLTRTLRLPPQPPIPPTAALPASPAHACTTRRYANTTAADGTKCMLCDICSTDEYAEENKPCGGHSLGEGGTGDRSCKKCPPLSLTLKNNSEAISSCLCPHAHATVPAPTTAEPLAFACEACTTNNCGACAPDAATCTQCKIFTAGGTPFNPPLVLQPSGVCSTNTDCGDAHYLQNMTCLKCTVCGEISSITVTKEECTATKDTVCGYLDQTSQAITSAAAEEEKAGILAALIVALIVGGAIIAGLIAAAIAALIFVRKLQKRNNALEGLHLDHMSLGVEVDDSIASAVMGEAVEMPYGMGRDSI